MLPAMPWTRIRCCKSSYHKLCRIYGRNNPADITRSISLAPGLYTTGVALLRECLYVRFSLCIANGEDNHLISQQIPVCHFRAVDTLPARWTTSETIIFTLAKHTELILSIIAFMARSKVDTGLSRACSGTHNTLACIRQRLPAHVRNNRRCHASSADVEDYYRNGRIRAP